MNAFASLRRGSVRLSAYLLFTALTFGSLIGTGCVDRWAGPGGSYPTLLSLRVAFSTAADQQENHVDEWRVQVVRSGEGVIAEAGGPVNPGQQIVQVPELSVTIRSECESLELRIELLSQGIVWWETARSHQVCATGNNQLAVAEGDWVWGGPPQPVLSTRTLQFTLPQGAQDSRAFTITYSGEGALPWILLVEETNLGWLGFEPASGSVTAAAPQTVSVSVDATGMSIGTYSAHLLLGGFPGPTQVISVELTVTQGPRIGLAPTALSFGAQQGTNPPAQTFSVTNLGGGTLSWSASDNAGWLGLSPASGTLAAGQSQVVNALVSTSNLNPGQYQATVSVASPTADNSPQTLPVTLTVTSGPVLVRSPASMTFNAVEGGSNPPSQTLSITNGGGGTLNWSVSDNVGWLSLAPTGGASTGETDNVAVSVSTAGLEAGTYNATITVSGAAPATGSPQTTAVTLVVAPPAPALVRSPASMTFNAVEGGSNPANQTLQISNGGGGTLSWSVSETSPWLSLSPTSGTATGETDNVTVGVNTAGLNAGTYNATITVTGAPPATGTPQTTAVTLVVAPPVPVLVRSPATMTFNAVEGGANPANQTLSISNGGGGTLTWSVADSVGWLSLAPTGGTSTGETDNVTVSVDIADLPAGTYNGTITITGAPPAQSSPQTTAVTLVVAPPAPVLVRAPASMTFNATQGGSNPPNQDLLIWNGGGGTLSWSLSDNAAWLSVSPTSGTSTVELDTLAVSVNIAGLNAGTYNGTILITGAPPATGSPQTVAVTLVVVPAPVLVRSPATMLFNAVQGGSNPASQVLSISNGGGSTLNWSVGDNAAWLSLSPTSGTSTGETDNVTASVNIAGLNAGTYNGTITVTGAPPALNSPQTTAVTLVVGPPTTSGPMLFTSGTTGQNEIWVRNASGTSLTQLTTIGAWDAEWSPNGTRIIFSSFFDGLNDHVWIMNADGSGQTALTTGAFQNVYSSWSPDGSKIVFSSGTGTGRNVWTMNNDGTNRVQLTNSGAEDSQADWSPNGNQIVFFSARSGTWQIWRMNTDGSSQTRLTFSGANDFFPAWSPDGSRIAFVSDRNGNYEIYVMNADGSNQTRLTVTSATELQPSWSPDGTKIVFMSDRDGQSEIYIMNTDGSNQVRLTNIPGGNQFPNIRN